MTSVLVVDDDDSIRLMVRAVLLHEGFHVDLAGSGNLAIARAKQTQYYVVVVDLMMCDGTGQQVIDALESEQPSVNCVVISAASPAQLDKIDSANVQAKLHKPFDIADLVSAVRSASPMLPAVNPG